MSTQDISIKDSRSLDELSQEKMDHNFDWVVNECMNAFERDKRRIILFHIDQNFYDEFKKRLSSLCNDSLIFMTVSGNINLRLLGQIYKKERVIVYDKFRNTKTYWEVPKEKRNPYTHIDADFFLNLNHNIHY